MTPHLQGYQHARPFYIKISTIAHCRNCPVTAAFFSAEYEEIDMDEPDTEAMREGIEAEMHSAGWRNQTCPHCLEAFPNLLHDDYENEEYDNEN
jgi:hypothetical protein